MEEYQIRSKEGIERLVNLISLSYSAVILLPYSDKTFLGINPPAPRKEDTKLVSKSSQI